MTKSFSKLNSPTTRLHGKVFPACVQVLLETKQSYHKMRACSTISRYWSPQVCVCVWLGWGQVHVPGKGDFSPWLTATRGVTSPRHDVPRPRASQHCWHTIVAASQRQLDSVSIVHWATLHLTVVVEFRRTYLPGTCAVSYCLMIDVKRNERWTFYLALRRPLNGKQSHVFWLHH